MSFLYLNKGKVRCTDEGFTIPEIKKIWNNDKTGKEKSYFNDVITGIFYIYKPRGIYWNKPEEERIERVNRDHLKNSSWQKIILREGVPELVTKYRDLSVTVSERIMEGIKNDFMELSRMMEAVPVTIRFTARKTIDYTAPDGSIQTIEVEKDVEIPNMDEKKELYDNWLSLSRILKEILGNLKIEEQERETEEMERRKFDTREPFIQPEEEQI